jgi:hypothetical protein
MSNIVKRLQLAANQMDSHQRGREQGRLIIDCLDHVLQLENEIERLKSESKPFHIVDVKPIQFTCQNHGASLPLVTKLNPSIPQ